MRRRFIVSWLVRSSLVAVGGCNAIVGTQDIDFVEPPAIVPPSPSSTSTSPPPPAGEGDAGTSVLEPEAGLDADVGGDAGVDEGSDGGVSGDF